MIARAEELLTDLLPTLRSQSVFRGDVYAIPGDADFALLWYRKDWFASENLNPPHSWDEWLVCLRHFQKPIVRHRYALGPHAIAFAGGGEAGEATTYQLLPVLWSAGAGVISNHEVVLNSRGSRDAVAFVAELVRKHGVAGRDVVMTPWNGPALAFAAGSVAMSIGGSYENRIIRAAAGWDEQEFISKVGFLPIPAGPGGTPGDGSWRPKLYDLQPVAAGGACPATARSSRPAGYRQGILFANGPESGHDHRHAGART